jgi:aryl-alcohol dehydrogenase-like predicted oxidoreductase
MAQLALAWILEHEAVTCVIPGGKRPAQVDDNARAADLPPLPAELRARIDQLYQSRIRPLVHQRW